APGENVLVDAVDERAIEVEEESGHACSFAHGRGGARADIIHAEPCRFLMRLFPFCAIAWIAAVSPAFAEGITIVLDFQGPRSEQSVKEMKHEFAGIMKDSALRFDFQSRSQAEQTTSSDVLVVVKFKGKCVFEPAPYLI